MKRQRLDVGGLRLEWDRRGHMDIGVQVNLCSKIRASILEVKIRQAVNRLSGYCRLEREKFPMDRRFCEEFLNGVNAYGWKREPSTRCARSG